MKCSTFILKCFLQYTCTNLDDPQKGGGGGTFALEGGGVPSEKGGSNSPLKTVENLTFSACFIRSGSSIH